MREFYKLCVGLGSATFSIHTRDTESMISCYNIIMVISAE